MASWSTEETFKFIETYQNEPSIWNPKHKFHKDKNTVNDSWTRIADELGVPVVELKKKKESLMTSFRTHLKKKKSSVRSGAGEDEIYKPVWVFYEAMEAFLKDIYQCKSTNNAEEDGTHIEHSNEQSEDNGIEEEPSGLFQKEDSEASKSNEQVNIKVRKRRSNNPPELMGINAKISCAFSRLNEVLCKNNNDDDECVLYGKLLAVKLKQFSPSQRSELMYEIDGLIMRKRQVTSPHSSNPSSHRTIPLHIPQDRTSMYLHKQYSADSQPKSSYVSTINSFFPPHDILTEASEVTKFSK